jgi:GGDEF domain-containing protein
MPGWWQRRSKPRSRSLFYQGNEINISVSIGISPCITGNVENTGGDHHSGADALLVQADLALYRSKDQGCVARASVKFPEQVCPITTKGAFARSIQWSWKIGISPLVLPQRRAGHAAISDGSAAG